MSFFKLNTTINYGYVHFEIQGDFGASHPNMLDFYEADTYTIFDI